MMVELQPFTTEVETILKGKDCYEVVKAEYEEAVKISDAPLPVSAQPICKQMEKIEALRAKEKQSLNQLSEMGVANR